MMIRIDTEYLDFNNDIEIEKQAKLFEDISGTNGDFSYSFQIENTVSNRKKLGIVSINGVPSYNSKVECVVCSNIGEDLYQGFLRIEAVNEVIETSFFSGNSNWFDLLKDNVRDFNYKHLDKDFTYTNVTNSFALKSGIVWPLVDKGTLNERDTPTIYDNDFQPFVYVKDVVKTILNQKGIKLEGDIIKNPIYNMMITSNGSLSGVQDKLDSVSVYAGKTSSQLINSTTYAEVTFQDTTNSPFIEGSDNNWDSVSAYTATKDIITLDIELSLLLSNSSGDIASPIFKITIDGVTQFEAPYLVDNNSTGSYSKTVTLTDIYAGSVIKLFAKRSGISLIDANYTIKTNSSIRFNVKKLRKVYANQLLPDRKANEYINSIFARLCMFVSYNAKNKTINTKFLDNIARAQELDLSQYVESFTYNTTEIIDDYGKRSNFLYQESGVDQINQYNSANQTPYGGGVLNIDNDFIEDEEDILELDEVAPFQVPISWLGFNLPLLAYSVFEAGDDQRFTAVDSNGGLARFKVSGTSLFEAGDLFRIKDSTNSLYDGVYKVDEVQTVLGDDYVTADVLGFDASASGSLEQVFIVDETNDDQVILLNLPSKSILDFSDVTSINWRRTTDNAQSTIALGYFWLPFVSKPINSVKEALYFDQVNDVQCYQKGLLGTYFSTANRILNDPIVGTAVMYLPEKVFKQIDFLSPIRIKTQDFNCKFLANRISGYVGSHLPCEVELIKLG